MYYNLPSDVFDWVDIFWILDLCWYMLATQMCFYSRMCYGLEKSVLYLPILLIKWEVYSRTSPLAEYLNDVNRFWICKFVFKNHPIEYLGLDNKRKFVLASFYFLFFSLASKVLSLWKVFWSLQSICIVIKLLYSHLVPLKAVEK